MAFTEYALIRIVDLLRFVTSSVVNHGYRYCLINCEETKDCVTCCNQPVENYEYEAGLSPAMIFKGYHGPGSWPSWFQVKFYQISIQPICWSIMQASVYSP